MSETRVPYGEVEGPFTGDAIWSPAGLDDRGVRFEGVAFEARQLPPPDNDLRFSELSYLARLISCQWGCLAEDAEPAVAARIFAWFLNEKLSVVEAAMRELLAFWDRRS